MEHPTCPGAKPPDAQAELGSDELARCSEETAAETKEHRIQSISPIVMAARDPPTHLNPPRGKPPTSVGDTTAAAPAPTGGIIINDGSVGKENGFKSGGLHIQMFCDESVEDVGEAQMRPGTSRHGPLLDERNRNGLSEDADMDESHVDILSEDDAGMHAGDVIDLSEDAGVSPSYGLDLCEDACSEGSHDVRDGSNAAGGRADDLEALLRRAGAVMEVSLSLPLIGSLILGRALLKSVSF